LHVGIEGIVAIETYAVDPTVPKMSKQSIRVIHSNSQLISTKGITQLIGKSGNQGVICQVSPCRKLTQRSGCLEPKSMPLADFKLPAKMKAVMSLSNIGPCFGSKSGIPVQDRKTSMVSRIGILYYIEFNAISLTEFMTGTNAPPG